MKITVSQLRRIISEEVEKNLTESSSMPLKDGGVVTELLSDTPYRSDM